jgi:hypothetical protein
LAVAPGAKQLSFPQEKRLHASALFTTPLRGRERAELETSAGRADSEIDYSDAPEVKSVPPHVYVGRFCRPVKP